MPLLHHPVAWPFRLDREAIEHPRLAYGEVANIDHLLHFAFAFGDDLSGLQRDQLTKLVFQFAQRVAETANGLAAHRSGRDAPFRKRFLRACDRLLVILVRSCPYACDSTSIDR